MSNELIEFTEAAEEMHAEAAELEAYWNGIDEILAAQIREDAAEAMAEARGNDGIRPVPAHEYGSLESRENAWAHAVLTGGEEKFY
jgi:hypothetical protein